MPRNFSASYHAFRQYGLIILLILFVSQMRLQAQTNLINNGNIESGMDGWTVWGATMSTTADAHSGSMALLVTNRKNSWDAAVQDITSVLVNGETYQLSVWVKLDGPATNFRATLALNVDNNTSYKGYLWNSSPVTGSYFFLSEEIIPQWTGNLLSANLYFETDAVNGVYADYQIDDVSLIKKITGPVILPDTIGLNDINNQTLIGGCITDGSKTYYNNATAKAQVLKDCKVTTIQCYPAWGRWDDTKPFIYHVDNFSSYVKQIKSQHIGVTAHMLLGWDQYFPNWFRNGDFSADTLDLIMKSWLSGIISYQGNDTLVDIWNVVNESISWNGQGGYWPINNADHTNACEFERMGYEPDSSGLTGTMKVNSQHPVYIRRAFEYARKLTNKKLELRDASIEFPTDSKYKAFYQLAMHLKKVGAPVDVIGFQAHLNLEQQYDWDGFVNNIQRYRKLGYEVNVDEVDVGDPTKTWTDEKADFQKMMYYRLVTSAIKGGASEIQTWGFYDDNNTGWRYGEKGLIYTNNFTAKPAYDGIKEAIIDMSQILFWEMDAKDSTSMPDVMKWNNYGKMQNFDTAIFTTGFKNKALEFDGVDDFIHSGNLSDTLLGNFTFSCFFSSTSNTPSVLANITNSLNEGIKIRIGSDGIIKIEASDAGMDSDLSGRYPVNDGLWHFIALQRDSNYYRLYVDSITPSAISKGNIDAYTVLATGASGNGAEPFAGLMDEVKLYNTCIEGSSLYRAMVPFCPIKLGLTQSGKIMKLSWTDQSVNEEGYLIERRTADGSWEDHAVIPTKKLNFTDTVELYSTTYAYRVRAINKFGKSDPSMSKSATSPADPHTDIHSVQLHHPVKIYPNPFSSTITIEGNEKSTIRIFDMRGIEVYKKENTNGQLKVEGENFPKGIYIVQISESNWSSQYKVVKD